jgi:hypothetical protein
MCENLKRDMILKIKIFAGLLGALSFVFATNLVSAGQIPAGYVLVPAEAFFGQGVNIAAPAAQVSIAKSSLRINDEIGYVGESYSTVTATLRDEAGNPLAGSSVNLISSRVTDRVEALQATTNANGEAVFRVLANEEGVSSFTAVADNQTVIERPRIVFLKKSGGIGGEFLASDVLGDELDGDTDNPVSVTDSNQVEAGFPGEVVIDSPTDISVQIMDADGVIKEDFTGTVSFESSDLKAILPQDYTFTGLDRGSHTFANAVTFTTPGDQIITITGGADTASKKITVKAVGSVAELNAPVITSPADGELLGGTVSFVGAAAANSNLALFADGQFLLEGESDASGNFLIEVELFDGETEITISILDPDDSIGATSEAISITVDQTAPTIETVGLAPGNRVVAGTSVGVEVKSETGLENAQLSVADVTVELSESDDNGGLYIGEFTAPGSGTYLLNVELTDEAGNIGRYPEATSLVVEVETTIENVETAPKDGRVDLRWDAPANSAEVQNYEILYGTNAEDLTQKFTTADNRTAWYVDQLNNKTNYFFQVVSLDATGKQNGGSDVFSATPAATFIADSCDGKALLRWERPENSQVAGYRLDYGVASRNYVESRVLPGGADLSKWEARDLINGMEYFFALRGIDDFGELVANVGGEVSVIPSLGKICQSSEEVIELLQRKDKDGDPVLVWNPVSGATSYRVYAGTHPNTFDLPVVEITGTSFRPKGLQSNSDYYFAVSAVFAGNHEASALSNMAKVEVGPAEILLISLLMAIGGSWLVRKKLSSGL